MLHTVLKPISFLLLLFLTTAAFAQEPKKEQTKEQDSKKTEQVKEDEANDANGTKQLQRKQRIPDQFDLFLPIVTNKYEPTT